MGRVFSFPGKIQNDIIKKAMDARKSKRVEEESPWKIVIWL
jgi:hypothetical protein